MDEACGEQSESELVLAVVPPVPRRQPWAAPPPPVAPEPPQPPPVPQAPPVPGPPVDPAPAPDVGGDAPAIVAGGADEPEAWPDRRWWTSTAVSTVVHVVLLMILALIVTPPDADRRPKPFVIAQPEPEEFTEPEQLVAMEVAPTDPAAAEPENVEIDAPVELVADAGAAAFDVPADAAGIPEFDVAGLGARIGSGAAGAGAGRAGAGFGGDVGRRLAAAGAKTGDVQVSLSWDNFNDIDLHVVAPSGERIFFGHRGSRCLGSLDVDMNAGGPASREPVENVFWPARRAPPGEYRVFVHHFSRHDPDRDDTAFSVHVLVDGRKRRFTGSVRSGDPPLAVATFRKGAGDGEPDDEFVE